MHNKSTKREKERSAAAQLAVIDYLCSNILTSTEKNFYCKDRKSKKKTTFINMAYFEDAMVTVIGQLIQAIKYFVPISSMSLY